MNSQEIEKQQNAFEALLKMMLEMLKHLFNFIGKIVNNVFHHEEPKTHAPDGRPLGSPEFEKANANMREKLGITDPLAVPMATPEKKGPDVDLKKENKVIPPENHTEAPKAPKAPKEDIKNYDYKVEGRHGVAEARDILKECDRTKRVEVAEGFFLVPKKELLEKQARCKEDDDFKKFDFSRADYFIISEDKQIIVNTPTDLKNFLNNKDKILDLKNPADAKEKQPPKENDKMTEQQLDDVLKPYETEQQKPKVKQKEIER